MQQASKVGQVLLDDLQDTPYDYLIPDTLSHLKEGARVEVPLRSRKAFGTIVALKEISKTEKLKQITSSLDASVPSDLIKLAQWISKFYLLPLGKTVKMMLPPGVRKNQVKEKKQLFIKPLLSRPKLQALATTLRLKKGAQATVLDVLLKHPEGILLSELCELTRTSISPIRTLEKQGVLALDEIRIDRLPSFDHDFFPTKPKTLSPEQQAAFDAITFNAFQAHLIHGITGSGKTEIYLQAIDKCLQKGLSVIYLIPEISLTPQTIERFKGRFGSEKLAILHSRLSDGERFDTWHHLASGRVQIAIGARSAIFSPLSNLGLVIVDEEHDSSYKQSESYHARDVAVLRAQIANCPILLGSATPSLESYHNAISGKYTLHTLKNRHGATLPSVQIIDMQLEYEKNKGFTLFSDSLLSKIKERVARGEQTLLFLNRRGYHTSATCPKCTYTAECPNCALALTYHRGFNLLACHLCDHRLIPPRHCPECKADGPLKFKGVGTELVEKSLQAILDNVRILRIDADTTRHKGSHDKLFRAFKSGKADVLIGTQMIAKGHHFPLVTLVGVINADASLHIPDFRASENVFQLLTQVAGRSGRAELPGEVVIQTQLPSHPVIQQAATQDYPAFYSQEIQNRRDFAFPPYSHLIKFTFSSPKEQPTEHAATSFRAALLTNLSSNTEVLPVTPCGYAKINGRFRFQFLIKSTTIGPMLESVRRAQASHKLPSKIRLTTDVDPLSTFF